MRQLRRPQPGDRALIARDLAELMDEVERLGKFSVGRGLMLSSGPAGVCLALSSEDEPAAEQWYELTANLDAGGTATAKPMKWVNGERVVDEEASEIEIEDLYQQYWGLSGERIRAAKVETPDGDKYEARSSGAPWHLVALSATLDAGATGGATATIRGASVSLSVTDVILPGGFTYDNGTSVFAHYDLCGKRWVILGKAFVSATRLTDYRYDVASHKFQKKTRDAAVLCQKVDESEWLDVYTSVVVAPVDGVQLSGLNFQSQDRNLYVLEDAGVESWSTWHTGSDCPT